MTIIWLSMIFVGVALTTYALLRAREQRLGR